MITLYINNKEVKLTKPTTVLKAARQAGFTIPTLCHDDLLEPEANCRLCLVEVENMPKLQTACTLMAADGMVVRTDTEEIENARKGILEFLLINHPLDCPTCDKAGECTLQELVNLYGAAKGRYREQKRKVQTSLNDPIIARNMERCIMCTRCIRMCSDVQGAYALSVVGRGEDCRVETFSGEKVSCEYCGNCITVCPVGSILSRVHLHSNRPWQVSRQVDTICGYCPVGCSVKVRVRDEKIRRVLPRVGHGVSKGLLCVRGRFGYDYVNDRDRLKTPMIKKNEGFHYCSWEEANTHAASRLQEVIDEYGPDACGAVTSGYAANEAQYVLQKFMRVLVGTHNIDSTARFSIAGAQRLLESLLYSGVTSHSLDDISNVDTVIVLGGDPTVINPILGLKVRGAYKRGAQVITLAPSRGLRRSTTLEVLTPLYEENRLLEKLIPYLYRERGVSEHKGALVQWIQEKDDSFDEHKDVTIPSDTFERLLELLLRSRTAAILLGPELIQRTDGFRHIISIAALTTLLRAKLYLISERPNEQGVIDMGCVPDGLPGRGLLSDSYLRKSLEKSWDVKISDRPGRTVIEMMEGIERGTIKALYIMGENPILNFPHHPKMKEALKKLELLIVQDIFFTDTARSAHVVFPCRAWSEEKGTFTNLEGRIQKLNKVVPGVGRDNWKIIADMAATMGYPMDYKNAGAVMNEISETVPLYKELNSKSIGSDGMMWPYNGELPQTGTDKVPSPPCCKRPKFDGPVNVKYETLLFHSGSLSQKSPILKSISSEPVLKVSPALMKEYRLENGDKVIVSSVIGTVEVPVQEDPFIPFDDLVLLSTHFPSASAYQLLGYALDPVTKAPGLDGWKVTIRKAKK